MDYNNYGGSVFGGYGGFDPFSMLSQGWNSMSNLGNTIGSQFFLANALNSLNRREQYPYEAAMTNTQMNTGAQNHATDATQQSTNRQTDALQQIQNRQADIASQLGNARLNQSSTILPMLISALSGIIPKSNGQGFGQGMDGFRTNFGQGASLGGAATPETPRAVAPGTGGVGAPPQYAPIQRPRLRIPGIGSVGAWNAPQPGQVGLLGLL